MDENKVNQIEESLQNLTVQFNNHSHREYDQTPRLALPHYIIWRVLDSLTSQSTGTTFAGDLEMPFDGAISAIGAFEDTSGTTGLATFDVNLNGTTIMTTTKITIDSGEKTTRTAATPAVLTTTSFAKGDIFTVDIDGVQTTPAKGLTIVLTIKI